MKNLNITTRLAISIAFLLLALAVLFYVYIDTISDHIDRARLEMDGTTYLRPLATTLDRLADYHTLRLQGKAASEADIKMAAQNVDQAFAEIQTTTSRLGTVLRCTESDLKSYGRERLDPSTLMAEWRTIASMDISQDIGTPYATLIRKLTDMAAHVDETSTLILDPDIGSYHLMDAVTVALTGTMSRLTLGERDIRQALAAPREREWHTKIWTLATLLEQSDQTRVNNGFNTSYHSAVPYYGVTPTLTLHTHDELAAYNAANDTLVNTLYAAVKTSSPLDATALDQAASVRKAAYALWNAGINDLDRLLQNRIRHYTQQRNIALTISILAICAALGFFWYVTHGITSSLAKIQVAMTEVANGKLDYQVPCLEAKDEIGHIARTLEAFRQSYWWLK